MNDPRKFKDRVKDYTSYRMQNDALKEGSVKVGFLASPEYKPQKVKNVPRTLSEKFPRIANFFKGYTNPEPIKANFKPTPTPTYISPTRTPSPSPTRMPARTPPATSGMYYDYEPYRASGNYTPPQPPAELHSMINEMYPNEATKAALTMATENGRFSNDAVNINRDGSGDYGLMQINSNTLKDFLRRRPDLLKQAGISSIEDLKDPRKNLKIGTIIRKEQGWGAWYGPKNRGFNLK